MQVSVLEKEVRRNVKTETKISQHTFQTIRNADPICKNKSSVRIMTYYKRKFKNETKNFKFQQSCNKLIGKTK